MINSIANSQCAVTYLFHRSPMDFHCLSCRDVVSRACTRAHRTRNSKFAEFIGRPRQSIRQGSARYALSLCSFTRDGQFDRKEEPQNPPDRARDPSDRDLYSRGAPTVNLDNLIER